MVWIVRDLVDRRARFVPRKYVLLNGALAVSSTGIIVWFIDQSTVYEDSDAFLEGFRYGVWTICYFILSAAAAPAWTLALPAVFQILMLFSPRISIPVVLFIFLSLAVSPVLCISMMSDQRRAFGQELCCWLLGFTTSHVGSL